ncbi:MAG: hypothetical protein JEY79_17355 [Pseudodesulfovibrio sp.]|nr:hypothetical protein [Pseudodesulfovibrio sp.]
MLWVLAGLALTIGLAYGAGLVRVSFSNVTSPTGLTRLFNAIDTELDATRTLTTELRTDHATNIAAIAANKTLVNDIRSVLLGDYIMSDPMLSRSFLASDNVQCYTTTYAVNGAAYTLAQSQAIALTPTTNVTQAKYQAYAFDVGANGTVDVGSTATAAGYDSAVLALAALSAVAADHVRLGTLTVIKSDGAFTPATTNLNAANVTATFADSNGFLSAIGAAVAVSPAASVTAAAVTEQVQGGK